MSGLCRKISNFFFRLGYMLDIEKHKKHIKIICLRAHGHTPKQIFQVSFRINIFFVQILLNWKLKFSDQKKNQTENSKKLKNEKNEIK